MIDNETKFRDRELEKLQEIIKLIANENKEQLLKWGVQEATLQEWMLWLTEEVGELSESVSGLIYNRKLQEKSKWFIKHEAIQVATLAVKIAEMMLEVE
jgi:NTP pyrophosphatase (non-canonical NTP hydrolase)